MCATARGEKGKEMTDVFGKSTFKSSGGFFFKIEHACVKNTRALQGEKIHDLSCVIFFFLFLRRLQKARRC